MTTKIKASRKPRKKEGYVGTQIHMKNVMGNAGNVKLLITSNTHTTNYREEIKK